MKTGVVVAVIVLAAVLMVEPAWGDGWVSFGPSKDAKVGPPPGHVNKVDDSPLPDDQGDDWTVALLDAGDAAPGAQGPAGPQGPQGPKGDKGDKGGKGDSADLCVNLPGVQTSAGWKRWPQRYWGFKPRLERRVLALNRKGQIVCVTLSWVKKHGWRGKR